LGSGDDEVVDVTDEFCDPDEGDDCEVESVASILDTTTTSTIYTYDATYISEDLLDYGYGAYVEGYLYQDDTLIADGYAYDDGTGAAELDGTISISLTDGPYAYELDSDSYIYDEDEDDDFYYMLSTEADVTLGIPTITSVSPAYAFVGTSGSLTIGGESLDNPFGGSTPTVSAVPGTSGGTGLTISGSYFGSNPQLSVSGGGATATIQSHTDSGQPNGAQIVAKVSVSNACDPGYVHWLDRYGGWWRDCKHPKRVYFAGAASDRHRKLWTVLLGLCGNVYGEHAICSNEPPDESHVYSHLHG